MKKLWVVAVLLAMGVLGAFAQTGEVYSLNVVGFQKLTAVSQGLVLVSTPFERSPNTLDDVIGPQLTGGKSEGVADKIVLWDTGAQTYRTYWLKAADSNWYNLSGQRATDVVLNVNQGFWIQNRRVTNQTVIVSGDVVDDMVTTNIIVPGMNLLSYPFSTEVDINFSGLTNGTGGKSEGVADKIAVWNVQAQTYVQYWLKSADKKWYTLSGSMATGVYVGGGRGFWYQRRGTTNFVWVEQRPYSL